MAKVAAAMVKEADGEIKSDVIEELEKIIEELKEKDEKDEKEI